MKMAKTTKYVVERCGTKFVVKNLGKPAGYICPNGRLTPFKDANTVMLDEEPIATHLANALNKNHTAMLIKTILIAAKDTKYASLLTQLECDETAHITD